MQESNINGLTNFWCLSKLMLGLGFFNVCQENKVDCQHIFDLIGIVLVKFLQDLKPQPYIFI